MAIDLDILPKKTNITSKAIAVERDLVAACLLACLRNDDGSLLVLESMTQVQLKKLSKLIVWNRLERFFYAVANTSNELPTWFKQTMMKRAQNASLVCFEQIKILPIIVKILDEISVNCLFVKGVVLSAQLYDDPAARHSKDIDVWVDESDVPAVARALIEKGFSLVKPTQNFAEIALESYLLIQKDLVFRKQGLSEVEVELHWRLDKNEYGFALSFAEAWQCRRFQNINGNCYTTLSLEHNLLYLAAHGTATYFGRLKWLLDWHDLVELAQRESVDWSHVFSLSESLNLQPSLRLAAKLAYNQLGQTLPVDKFNAKLPFGERKILKVMEANISLARYPSLLQRWPLRLFMVRGWRYKLRHVSLGVLLFRHEILSK